MKKLDTLQKENKLNEVYATDNEGIGGAHHIYEIKNINNDESLLEIRFQNGPRKEKTSNDGVIDTDLLEIVKDRFESFTKGEFSDPYTLEALGHINQALKCLDNRVKDRANRNVLGKEEK